MNPTDYTNGRIHIWKGCLFAWVILKQVFLHLIIKLFYNSHQLSEYNYYADIFLMNIPHDGDLLMDVGEFTAETYINKQNVHM